MKILLQADVPEPRVLRDRLTASADGTTWDERVNTSGVWVDPVTRTLMLRPRPLDDAWATTFTGDYARLPKSAYTLTTPAAWVENPKRGTGDIYLECIDDTKFGESVVTTADYSANRAWFVSYFNNGTGDEKEVVFECAQGVPEAASTVSLRIRGNGDVDLFKGTDYLATYDLSSLPDNLAGARTSGKAPNLAQSVVSFLWIPCRGRDLVLYCITTGGGFVHTFADLPANVVNDVTPDGKFSWRILTGRPSVQIAPLKFHTSGSGYGKAVTFRYPPETGRVFTAIDASDGPGYGTTGETFGLVNADDLTPFTPDGTADEVRVEASLSGDGDWTSFVYACDVFASRTTTTTANDPYDLTCEVSELSFEVDEEGRGKISFVMPRPELSTLPRIEETHERPFRLAVQSDDGLTTVDVMRGTLEAPEKVYRTFDGLPRFYYRFTGWDRTREFGKYWFVDAVPYDGLELMDVVNDLHQMVGFSASDADATSDIDEPFQLPFTTGVSLGEWRLIPDRDETVEEWIEQLFRAYAPTWYKGWRPTASGYKWQFKRPTDLPTLPTFSLYMSRADATTQGVSSALLDERVLFTDGRTRRHIAPEANSISVVGYDPRLKRNIASQSVNVASATPGTAPGLRPANWLGRTERYQFIDESLISTQAAVDRALALLTDRLTVNRIMEEWQCRWLVNPANLVPLWRGDVVELWDTVTGLTTGTGSYYRIRSLSVQFEQLGQGDDARKILRTRARYTVERSGARTIIT